MPTLIAMFGDLNAHSATKNCFVVVLKIMLPIFITTYSNFDRFLLFTFSRFIII